MIHHGDNLEILKTLPSDSVDSLVTDPPAGISFMGKTWDSDKGGSKQWIAWMAEVMTEAKRVMKPGAHGLVWAIPRTSHWTAMALEDAGFEIRDIVVHLFGSGFPKSLNMAKAIDVAKAKKISENSCMSSGNYERLPTHDPVTEEAKYWKGFGTALKPASEHWILIRKPISEKTVAANVLKWGCGGLNIDGSRIGTADTRRRSGKSAFGIMNGGVWKPKALIDGSACGRFPANLVLSHSEHCTEESHMDSMETKREWHCAEGCAILELNRQSGPCETGELSGQPRTENKIYGSAANTLGKPRFYQPDAATGASRFFYCAKTSKSERNAGLEDMPDQTKAMSGGAAAAAARGETEYGPKTARGYNQIQTVKNHHPTVKPLKLMRYFCKLITPPDGLILDPFAGSGSTGVAAIQEGFKFVGIERELDYVQIGTKRIFHAMPEFKKTFFTED